MEPQNDRLDSTSPGKPSNRQVQLMLDARSRATFEPRNVTVLIYGGEESLREREAAFARVHTALGLNDTTILPRRYENCDRLGAYHRGLEAGRVLLEEKIQHGHDVFDVSSHHYSPIIEVPFGQHLAMFLSTLRLQASDDQLKDWLPMAESGKITGTYCQTELGHGTFVRGLETTATFDISTDELIIHSPTLTSTKYWPGGLGFSCSHAIVMARLLVAGTDYGVHAVFMQLRSLDDFTPLPGIELGDIGLKYGLNETDNGYAIFNQHRVPRTNLLMRHAKLLKDGSYIKAAQAKHVYATMTLSRNLVSHCVVFQLAQAATIATRYSVVREQGHGQSAQINSQEVAIISYRSQNLRLFTHLARAFTLLFASKSSQQVYTTANAEWQEGNYASLPYIHMLTAALKAYSTQTAIESIEDCRKCCGGHGYSVLSGLPHIITNILPTATVEGDNHVMYLQAARYFMKAAATIRQGKPVESQIRFLSDAYRKMYQGVGEREYAHEVEPKHVNHDSIRLGDFGTLAQIIEERFVRIVFECESLLREAQLEFSVEAATNEHLMTLMSMARAFIEYFVVRSFSSHIDSADLPQQAKAVLRRLCKLQALDIITTPTALSPSFLEHSCIKQIDLRMMRMMMGEIVDELLPDAIALTDSWGFSDSCLASALGVYDGNVYETLMGWTKQVPMNLRAAENGGVEKYGYDRYIKGLLDRKVQAEESTTSSNRSAFTALLKWLSHLRKAI